MEYIGVTITGVEDVAITEVKELVDVSAKKIIEGRIKFSVDDLSKLEKYNKSLIRIYQLLAEGESETVEGIAEAADKLSYDFEGTFVVKCTRKGEQIYNSKEIERSVGEVIYEKGFKVDLKKPENVIFVDVIDNKFLIGILVNKNDYHRRDYRVRQSSHGINACLAYIMVRLAKFNESKVLVDAFCTDGVIPIEAALFAKGLSRELSGEEKEISGKIYSTDDNMANVRAAETNAKLAEVNKLIEFSRQDIDWLDKKLEENSVDCFASLIPSPSKHFSEKRSVKIYSELFYQMDYIMKKKGVGIFLMYDSKVFEKNLKYFKVKEKINIMIGAQPMVLVILSR